MSIFNQSATAMNQAMNGTRRAGMGFGNLGFGASQAQAGTIAGTGMGQYMNPYTNQVVNRSMQDMNQARQMAMNDVGAQATAAGAFGGSRHGLVEAQTNREFADAAGDMSAGLRQQGYNTALGAAQFDAGQRQNTSQFNAGQQQSADLASDNLFLQGKQQQMNAAGQLGSLGGQAFGMGQQVNQMQGQAGAQQQAIQQQLINAAKGQYGGFTGAPMQGLQGMVGSVSGIPIGQSQTTSQNPGILGMLAGGASMLGGLGWAPFCWASRAAFGADNPEWLTVRQWMLIRAPKWLFRAYVKHGQRLAAWIDRHPRSKPAFRAMFRKLVKV